MLPDEIVPGDVLGGHRLLFRLGKGGMGEVWAAVLDRDLGFRKLVAVKLMRSKDVSSNAAVMFADEAKAAAALQHACIVSTMDFGREGDLLYLVMDMVHGPSLTALLQRLAVHEGSMKPSVVAHIGVSIAAALDYAYERATHDGKILRLVHRDVSPHNVLLDLNGAVRLTDFGVARTAVQEHKSRVGTVRGKPSYMAPEQVRGEDIDARTDVFALGIVLYESACLKRLFGRSNPVKSMEAVVRHTPKAISEMVPGFPERLWLVLKKALEKEPKDRFQSAGEMLLALQDAAEALPDYSSAQRDLMALVEQNFEDKPFNIEERLEEAAIAAVATRSEAGRSVPSSSPSRPPSSTAMERPRHLLPAENLASSVAKSFVDVQWPVAQDSDPLAPEVIEVLRTSMMQRRPAPSPQPMPDLTPSASSPLIPVTSSGVAASRFIRPRIVALSMLVVAAVAIGLAAASSIRSQATVLGESPSDLGRATQEDIDSTGSQPLGVRPSAGPVVEPQPTVKGPPKVGDRPAAEVLAADITETAGTQVDGTPVDVIAVDADVGSETSSRQSTSRDRSASAASMSSPATRSSRSPPRRATKAAAAESSRTKTPSPAAPTPELARSVSYGQARAMVLEARRIDPNLGGPMISELLELGETGDPARIREVYRRAAAIVRSARPSSTN